MVRRVAVAALFLVLVAAVWPAVMPAANAAIIQTSGRPLAPVIAFSPRTNSYLLVWSEDRGLGTGLDLYATRLTNTGLAVAGAVPLVMEPGNQSDPAIAWSEGQEAFLLFYTNDALPAAPTPGVPIPATPGVPPPFPTSPPPVPLLAIGTFPRRVAALPQGGAIIQQPTFPPPPVTPGPTMVPTALPTPGGPPGPTPIPTPVTTPANPPAPPIAAPGSRDIYGLWVADGGQVLSGTFPVIASPADDTFPAVAYRASVPYDLWALVWREVTGTTVAIKAMKLTGYGGYLAITGSPSIVTSGGDQGRPSVAIEVSGEGLIVWSETPTGAAARDIRGRRINLNMFPIGPFLELTADAHDQVVPTVASLGEAGGYLLAWENREAGNPPDIRLRRLNRNGIPLRQVYELAGGPPFSFSPNLPSTDRSTRLLVWLDRNAASDHSILGAEVNRDGRRTGPERVLVAGGSGPAGVTPAAPPAPFPTLPPLPPVPTP